MKRIFTFLILLSALGTAKAQPWTYNFGTGTGSHTTNSVVLSTDVSPYLPAPETNGGTARTRVGSGSGSFNIENPGISTLGTNSEMRMVAPTGTSVNKFSVFDYTGGKEFAIKFYVRFDGGASGVWSFVCGNHANFSDNNSLQFTGVYAGLRFTYAASDAITAQYRNAAAWTALPSNPFSQKTNFKVEIYGNNTTGTINYTYGTAQSIATNTFDLWVDGVLIGNDLSRATGLANDTDIDSWMLVGESSTSNVANLYIDDISYSNSVQSHAALPISLVKFEAEKLAEKVKLTWTTATEINNQKFIVERAANGEDFTSIAEVRGAGNSKELNEYTFVDATPLKGTAYYRLTQVDFDGTSTSFEPVAVNMSKGKLSMEQGAGNVEQGTWSIYSPMATEAMLDVKDINGKVIYSERIQLKEGYQQHKLNLNSHHAGIYVVQLIAGKESITKKIKVN